MNRTSTTVLAVIAVAMFTWITVKERHSLSTGELEGRRQRLVERFVRARVDRVELERAGVTTVLEVTRPDDGTVGDWRVLEPYEAEADAEAVGSVLGLLEWSDARRTLENVDASDLVTFGLDEPRIVARFVMDGEVVELRVGADEANGGGVYATADDGETVAIAGRDVFEGLDHDAGHFRSKRLLARGVLTADSVIIEDERGRRDLRKDGERWLIGSRLASQGAVDEVLQSITDLEAERYVEARPGEPSLEVRASRPAGADEEGERVDVRLAVYGDCPGHENERLARFWVSDEQGPLVCVTSRSLEAFQRLPEQFEETRPITFSDLELEQLTLVAGPTTLQVSREGDTDWSLTVNDEDAGDVDAQALGDWLRDIRRARATSIRPADDAALRAHGLDAPSAVLTVRANGDRTEVLQVGAVSGEGLFARRAGEPVLLVLPSEAEALFRPESARLRPRDVTTEDPRAITALEVERGGVVERLARDGEEWAIVAPIAAPADRSAIRELLRKVASLSALRFDSDAVREEHGLSRPRFIVRFAVGEDDETRRLTLEVGAESRDGSYARLSGTPGVFVISPNVVDAVAYPLVSRDLLATPSYELEAITIHDESGDSLVLRQDGGRFVTDDGPVDDGRMAELTRVVGRFRAQRADRYGAAQPSNGYAPARARVEIQRADGADAPLSYEMLIGAPDGAGAVHVRRTDLAVDFLVEEALVDGILAFEP